VLASGREESARVNGDELGVVTTVLDVVGRARTRAAGCAERAREHELSYRRWHFWSNLLGVLTAIGAAVAASALLFADSGGARAVVAGLVALAAAAFATVNTAFLQSRVEEHRAARAAFMHLRGRYAFLRDLPPKETAAARVQLEDIERAHVQAEIESPPPEAWARQRRTAEEERADARPPEAQPLQPPATPEPAATPERRGEQPAPTRTGRSVAPPNRTSSRTEAAS
jgi:hypothetical protein